MLSSGSLSTNHPSHSQLEDLQAGIPPLTLDPTLYIQLSPFPWVLLLLMDKPSSLLSPCLYLVQKTMILILCLILWSLLILQLLMFLRWFLHQIPVLLLKPPLLESLNELAEVGGKKALPYPVKVVTLKSNSVKWVGALVLLKDCMGIQPKFISTVIILSLHWTWKRWNGGGLKEFLFVTPLFILNTPLYYSVT